MYPEDFKYTKTHEYVKKEDNGNIRIGITKYALDHLGDIVFLELPKVGDEVSKGSPCGTIESVKAVEDLYSPLSGKVVQVNEEVLADPLKIGENPYETGWLFKITPSDMSEYDSLLSVEEYKSQLE